MVAIRYKIPEVTKVKIILTIKNKILSIQPLNAKSIIIPIIPNIVKITSILSVPFYVLSIISGYQIITGFTKSYINVFFGL